MQSQARWFRDNLTKVVQKIYVCYVVSTRVWLTCHAPLAEFDRASFQAIHRLT